MNQAEIYDLLERNPVLWGEGAIRDQVRNWCDALPREDLPKAYDLLLDLAEELYQVIDRGPAA